MYCIVVLYVQYVDYVEYILFLYIQSSLPLKADSLTLNSNQSEYLARWWMIV